MCEFNDMIEVIAALDADVISIEDFAYPNEIGPGIYDIHSPRVPGREEMLALLRQAAERISPERLWVNPDCGLKTRAWAGTEAALASIVAAAPAMRAAWVQAAKGSA